ncbi:MAG TPA: hypothetical protein VJH03_26675 [Blastocatellia bacterium]|nr:hypothetical protein [Blastocatellia bacterium]
MNRQGRETRIGCRQTRRSFGALAAPNSKLPPEVRLALGDHLEGCPACAREHEVFLLSRAALDAAAAPDVIEPGREFFALLRARIARGPNDEEQLAASRDDSWAAVLTLAARQLIPAMAMLLVLIIGATLLIERWSPSAPVSVSQSVDSAMIRAFEAPVPTPADELERLVAVEEREDGK